MIFIIGGAFQGKTEYVNSRYGEEYEIVNAYHINVRSQLEAGISPVEEAVMMLEKAKSDHCFDRLVIVSDELGYGLVPMDAFQREYREINGRVNCLFAEQADSVYRVVCGIAHKIK